MQAEKAKVDANAQYEAKTAVIAKAAASTAPVSAPMNKVKHFSATSVMLTPINSHACSHQPLCTLGIYMPHV